MGTHPEKTEATLSIGAVSKATDIPVETLRTWERRYGFPRPQRAASGHRRYSASVIPHLKLISHAIDKGHRPVNVVGESMETLKVLLDLTQSPEVIDAAAEGAARTVEPFEPERPIAPAIAAQIIDGWMEATMRLDAEQLRSSLESTWYRVGAMPFLDQLLSPFLSQIGQAWFEGRIAVLHEQFASNQLRKFLSEQWRPLSERAKGPRVVCTTLPGEYHAIGLHMVSVVVALLGCQVVFLGIDTPLGTIADAMRKSGADAVLLSVSAAANATSVAEQVTNLRGLLDRDARVILGGSGAPTDVEGILHFGDLQHLSNWIQVEYLSA
jgi:methanogenic corrinoid protein MtbC1